MTEGIAILGIDAADYRLVKKWDCENLLLNSHAELEPITHSLDKPATLEVWPTIATGLLPEDHGVTVTDLQWDSKGLQLASKVTQYLPSDVRYRLGNLFRDNNELQSPQTDSPHIFENGAVYNWPGITPATDWGMASKWFGQVKRKEISEQEFFQYQFGNAGKGVGWLASQISAGVPIAGAHIHVLDHMGHVYAKRPSTLEDSYKKVDELVGWLREKVPRLIVVSDHGMQTVATDDSEPGVHSWHGLIASTGEREHLPETVVDVRDWLEGQIIEENSSKTTTDVDAPTEHLRELGYIE